MALSPIFKKAYWSLAILGGLWFLFISALLIPWLQRHALYANKLHTAWWQDLDQPEQWGFLKNQVQPFNISTPDGEVLYSWHVLPLARYLKHEEAVVDETRQITSDVTNTKAFEILTDPEALLVINFHGNAGTIGQGWRTDTYRNLASGSPARIHVLGFDYRGFGYSTGSPTEQGLITDGVAVVDWALQVAKVPPEKIVLVGQSLGTAVATAVAEHFSTKRSIDFKGLVLVAGFSDLPKLLTTYSIGGFIPLLKPLRPYPKIQKFFEKHIKDTWHTATRLANLMRVSKHLNLFLIHAKDDFDIPWSHSNGLFHSAANATTERGMTAQQIDDAKDHKDLGIAGWQNTWKAGAKHSTVKQVKQTILESGGHNRIMTYPPVAKAVLECFGESAQ